MAYTRKTSDIITSFELDYLLEQIKDSSEVARLLLKKRHQVESLVDDHVNYISVSNSDPTKISYLTTDRINYISEKGEDLWTSQKRFHIKPGSFVSKLFKGISLSEIQNFSVLFRNVVSKVDTRFEIVSGPQIRQFYHFSSYLRESGSLGNSCMKYDQCQDYFDLYVKNPDLIRMVVLLNHRDRLIGRALIWDDGNNKIMDRIYTIDDDSYQFSFKKWADDNGYWYKKEQKWNNTLYFESKGKVDCKHIDLQLEKFNFSNYPYMDTFKFFDPKTGKLYNYQPKNVSFVTISSADGNRQPQNMFTLCDKTNMFYSSDSIVYIPNRGMSVCSDYTVYSDIYDCYILREDADYNQDLNDWIYQDSELNNDILINQRKKENKGSNLWANFEFPIEYTSGDEDSMNPPSPPIEYTPF
jgi:hypothetical protein